MTHRENRRQAQRRPVAVACLMSAVWLMFAACSGASPTADTAAPASTGGAAPASATPAPTTRPAVAPDVQLATTAPAPAATAAAERQPSATPITLATATPPTAPAAPAAAATASAAQGAMPDRPFGPRSRDSGCTVHDALPDAACTPGAIFPDATAEQVCQRGYSTSVRNVPAAISREVYRAYGIVERTTGEYEVDHHVALEIGGSNDIANLWPEAAEPRPGFHEKDQVENYLHDQVCAGRMGLFEAQRAIATNWLDVFQRLHQPVLPTLATAVAVPQLPPAPANGGVQITSVSGAAPGGRATITAYTAAGASCSIAYRTPAGTISTAQGLTPRTADSNGLVTWSWSIGPSTRPGTGSVTVACSGASVSTPIQIN
jgi:hypothetical protein